MEDEDTTEEQNFMICNSPILPFSTSGFWFGCGCVHLRYVEFGCNAAA
jgi:hypothetical protein